MPEMEYLVYIISVNGAVLHPARTESFRLDASRGRSRSERRHQRGHLNQRLALPYQRRAGLSRSWYQMWSWGAARLDSGANWLANEPKKMRSFWRMFRGRGKSKNPLEAHHGKV